MASIFKRGATWYVKYYVHGKQVYESLHTRSERVVPTENLIRGGEVVEGGVPNRLIERQSEFEPPRSSCPTREPEHPGRRWPAAARNSGT